MHESSPQGRTLTYQITQLIGQLQQLVHGPNWSYRLEEVHTLLAALADAWACHQHRWYEPMLEVPAGQGTEDYPRPRGLPTTCYPVECPYTRAELHALFVVACQGDVERGGRYDAHRAAINLWTQPWPPESTTPSTDDSTLVGTWYFRWGDAPGLWQIELDEGHTLAELGQALGALEDRALGHVKHGGM
jgi:hypothetical protein